ncbi:ferredoxin [Streptomyces sp. NPDC021212]|uniref:ferredoxin n=1 Tax=Streptomyces sp. NPDC021212 TaxID=3365118 RepID=UPI0037A6C1A6
MHVTLDQDRCVASGQCVLAAPAVFDQRDDDGVAVLLDDLPSSGLHGEVRRAAAGCPGLAIALAES